jgi:hypothetical protein
VPISLGQLPNDPDALKRIIAAMAQDALAAQTEIEPPAVMSRARAVCP